MTVNREETSLLIVDDEPSIFRLLAGQIGLSFSFSTAASAEEAADILSRESFKLVMTDIRMPGASGVDLCRSINDLYPDTVVILMSGSAEVRDVMEAMKEGAYDCLLKPFDEFQVMVGIERAFRHQTLLAAVNRLGPEYNGKPADVSPASMSEPSSPTRKVLRRSYHATLRSAAEALGDRDAAAVHRSNRIVAACLMLGTALGLSQGDLIGLQQGALLYDIGRIGDADEILFKPGSMTQYEWTRASAHVVQGLRIIDGIRFLAGARVVVGQHHERFDGSGYPIGLSGDSIHLNARIFLVADAFNAIAGAHPGSMAECYDAARKEIAAGSGAQFDPRVVNAFLGIAKEEWKQTQDAGEARRYVEGAISKTAIHSFMVTLASAPHRPKEMRHVKERSRSEEIRVRATG